MPAPGDQWRDSKITNPFETQQNHVNEYTAQEIATLQSRLDKQLGPEYISTRPGAGGGKVHYLAAEKVINLANEVFGFNGWSSAIREVQIDFVDEAPGSGKITLGLSTIVRVSLKDGTFHEDIGYGHIENCKGKAAAFEKAKKEAVTDALKRALRNFGNVLGNCLYDKDYLSRVTKVKIAPSKWDAENLHRHPDFAPVKKEPAPEIKRTPSTTNQPARLPSGQSTTSNMSEFEDEFGGNLFDEVDFSHPDEVRLDNSITDASMDTPVRQITNGVPTANGHPPNKIVPLQNVRQFSGGRPQPNVQNGQQQQAPQRFGNANPQSNQAPGRMMPPPPNQTSNQNALRSNPSSASDSTTSGSRQATPPGGPNLAAGQQAPAQVTPTHVPPNVPAGFVSGSAAAAINQQPEGPAPAAIKPFDVHHESPSIRRTQGLNLRKSEPIKRSEVNAPSVAPQAPVNGTVSNAPANKANFVNPAMDAGRRIGMPGGMQSPLANRGAYKPPMKRSLPTDNAIGRPPLADMSNVQQPDTANDAKRVKTEAAQQVQQQQQQHQQQDEA